MVLHCSYIKENGSNLAVDSDPVTDYLESIQAKSNNVVDEQNKTLKSRSKRRRRSSLTHRKSHKCPASSFKELKNNESAMRESLPEVKSRVTCGEITFACIVTSIHD